ncbi:MAG: CIA30 family protein [Planctomycetota bacterium]
MIAMVLSSFAFFGLPAAASDVVTDFSGNGASLRWYIVNDTVMGGRSSSKFDVEEGALTFAGTLNTNGGGFASIRTRPSELPLAGSAGVHLRVRADGREYQLRLEQRGESSRRTTSYRAKFKVAKGEGWQDVWLPYSSFIATWRGRTLDRPPVDAARVASIGLMVADGIDGPFKLEVESIRTYKPFAMNSLRWSARPLVVFAPKADDERVKLQLAAIEKSRTRFAERDMVLVLIVDDGTSYAGSRPLTRAESEAVRRDLRVERGRFVVKLVGKDGGVKHVNPKPSDLLGIYEKIDGMPMRRSEMRE